MNETDFIWLVSTLAIVIFLIFAYMYAEKKIRKGFYELKYETNFTLFLKYTAYALLLAGLIFNFFIYFSQPNTKVQYLGVERQNRPISFIGFDDNQKYSFNSQVFKILMKDYPSLEFNVVVQIMWDNIFIINNIIIILIFGYALIVKLIFNISVFS
jgi:hypothetical protein